MTGTQKSTMHTKDILAAELRKIGLFEMAEKAAAGYYHDFESPLATPCLQLAADLAAVGTPAAMALRERHMKGEFDATKEESDEWAASEDGQETFSRFVTDFRAKTGEQIGRLALRVEGDFWNAYYAMPDTMDRAIMLGSIRMRFVEMQERKDAFMTLMREAVSDIIEEKTGTRPIWPEPRGQPAPENERSGHG